MYQLESDSIIKRISDNSDIPKEEGNSDYAAYLEWVKAGNKPTVKSLSAEEIAAGVRAERDHRLAACDWSQLTDIAPEVREVWAAYRQALRDVSMQAGFPHRVEWPTPPNTD